MPSADGRRSFCRNCRRIGGRRKSLLTYVTFVTAGANAPKLDSIVATATIADAIAVTFPFTYEQQVDAGRTVQARPVMARVV